MHTKPALINPRRDVIKFSISRLPSNYRCYRLLKIGQIDFEKMLAAEERRMSIKKNKSNFKLKRFSTNKKVLSQGILMWNIKAPALGVPKLLARLKLSTTKMGQAPWSRSQCQQKWYPQKDLITMNTHVKYQFSRIHCSKVISKIKVFKNESNSKVKVTG